MARTNLSQLVRDGIEDDEVHLVPVIKKELIHYDVLESLEALGLLERLVFHGGTCLRLCYGAQRRSEDLDFAYSGNLDELDLAGLQARASESLGRKYGLAAVVHPPQRTVQFANAHMQRWWMVVDTAPERPDLPSQRLKIGIVSVRTFTRVVRRIARNYDFLFPSAGNTLAVCESQEEILADKMVSFVNTSPAYVRSRDVWDMLYLLSRSGCSDGVRMVPDKMQLYGCSLDPAEFAQEGARRATEVVDSVTFQQEMQRFMPAGAFEALLGSELKRTFALDELRMLYATVAQLARKDANAM